MVGQLQDVRHAAPGFRRCDHPACGQLGEYRAPRSRYELDRHYWFCLEHVREYNAAWDYFADMNQEEIEQFQRSNAFWHRPTWRIGGRVTGDWFENGVPGEFGLFGADEKPYTANPGEGREPRPFKPGERQALAEMNLEWPLTLKEIKDRYKTLAKQHHPDTNGGDKEAEERLKTIIQAYTHLLTCGYS